MRGWGVTLLVLGIGSFVLPMMGIQFVLLSVFGNATPIVGGVLALAGLAMVIFGGRGDSE